MYSHHQNWIPPRSLVPPPTHYPIIHIAKFTPGAEQFLVFAGFSLTLCIEFGKVHSLMWSSYLDWFCEGYENRNMKSFRWYCSLIICVLKRDRTARDREEGVRMDKRWIWDINTWLGLIRMHTNKATKVYFKHLNH